MPIYIEEMSADVTVVDGELPLSEAQVELLVEIIIKRLEGRRRESQKVKEATALRRGAAPSMRVGE